MRQRRPRTWWPFPRRPRFAAGGYVSIDVLPDPSTFDAAIAALGCPVDPRTAALLNTDALTRLFEDSGTVDPGPSVTLQSPALRPDRIRLTRFRPPAHRGPVVDQCDADAEAVHDHLVADLERWTRGQGRGRHAAD